MSAGDPIITCPFCGFNYYMGSGHICGGVNRTQPIPLYTPIPNEDEIVKRLDEIIAILKNMRAKVK